MSLQSENKSLFFALDMGSFFTYKNGMEHLYYKLLVACVSMVLCLLDAKFQQDCVQCLQSYTIVRTYITFKLDFSFENYLLAIKDYNVKRCVAKFRLGIHDLKIESGRHTKTNTPVVQRICQMSNLNQIECKKYFILLCPRYEEHRIKLFVNIIRIEPQLLLGHVIISCLHN